jgi:hypothetical protein
LRATAVRIDVTTLIIGAWRIAEVSENTKSVAAKMGPSVSTRNASVAAGDIVGTLSPIFQPVKENHD